MKKLFIIMMAILMIFSITACDPSGPETKPGTEDTAPDAGKPDTGTPDTGEGGKPDAGEGGEEVVTPHANEAELNEIHNVFYAYNEALEVNNHALTGEYHATNEYAIVSAESTATELKLTYQDFEGRKHTMTIIADSETERTIVMDEKAVKAATAEIPVPKASEAELALLNRVLTAIKAPDFNRETVNKTPFTHAETGIKITHFAVSEWPNRPARPSRPAAGGRMTAEPDGSPIYKVYQITAIDTKAEPAATYYLTGRINLDGTKPHAGIINNKPVELDIDLAPKVEK